MYIPYAFSFPAGGYPTGDAKPLPLYLNRELTPVPKSPTIKPMDNDYANIVEALGPDNQAFAGKTVLLTGSQGFLGRLYQQYFKYLNEHVLNEPVKVICMDNMVAGQVAGSGPLYIQDDITNSAAFSGLRPADYVICAAGLASPRAYESRAFQTLAVSVQGTMNVLEYCCAHGIKRPLFFSSSEVYGDPDADAVPTPETYVGRINTHTKRSAYDLGKMCIQTLVDDANAKWNLDAQVVAPFNIIGPSGEDGRVLPTMVGKLLRGEKIKVFLPGTQTRTFCWFSDFVAGSIKVMLHGDGFPVNVGNSDNEVSMLDLARKLEALSGRTDAIELVPPTAVYKTEPMRRCPDITRARGLGYEPRVSLDEALVRFWGWASVNYPKS